MQDLSLTEAQKKHILNEAIEMASFFLKEAMDDCGVTDLSGVYRFEEKQGQPVYRIVFERIQDKP